MSTTAVYQLLRVREHEDSTAIDDHPDEGLFQVGERSKWDFALELQRMDAGVTLEVVIETSPTGDDDSWSELVSFGSVTDTTGDPITKNDQAIDAGEQYVKARPKTLTGGDATFGVTASSPFFRPTTSDDDLLSQALRELNVDDRIRLVERAEAMVLDTAIGRDRLGKLEADLTETDSLGRIRRAIARQAEHLHMRDKLSTSREASALVSLREMSEMAEDARELVARLLPHDGAFVWRGR